MTVAPVRILVIPDTHAPAHDVEAWGQMMDYARFYKPTHIVILGDFVDCYHLSKYAKSRGMPSTSAELVAANDLLDELDSLGAQHKFYLLGNHEHRLYEKLSEAGLEGVVDWCDDSMLGLDSRNWSMVRYGDVLRLGNVRFIHDAGPAGKNGSQATLDFMHCNVVHGHTHRGRVLYQGDGLGRTHVCLSPGWLGDLTAPHMNYEKNVIKTKAWTQGFGIVSMDLDGDFVAQLIPILKNRPRGR